MKVGRNSPCPCGRLKKFKNCCLGKVDWEQLYQARGSAWLHHLSTRGRNQLFLSRLVNILGLDQATTKQRYKSAFTAKAVSDIHRAVLEVWPPDLDINAALRPDTPDVAGLYVGDYSPEFVLRGIVRHSIYANKILVVDPFLYPGSVRPQYDPIENPSQYRAQTLKNANFWFRLAPWIEAGLIEIIRTPADFDRVLNWESMKRQEAKFENSPTLKKAIEATVGLMHTRHMKQLTREHMLLEMPDSELRRVFDQAGLGNGDPESFARFINYIRLEREKDPDFLAPVGEESPAQLHMFSTGANLEIASLTARLAGAYLVTDMPVRWKEIELEYESLDALSSTWSPFAKAVQEAPFKYLENVGLNNAMKLRSDGRLESMRRFMNKLWRTTLGDSKPFSDQTPILLAEELQGELAKAKEEWQSIDADLLKLTSAESLGGILAAGPLIEAGHAAFLASAVLVAGASALGVSAYKRSTFHARVPAAFFMEIDESA